MALKNIRLQTEQGSKDYITKFSKISENLFEIEINNKIINVKLIQSSPYIIFEINGKLHKAYPSKNNLITISNGLLSKIFEAKILQNKSNAKEKKSSSSIIMAPLSGRIIKKHVFVDQYVKKGQELLTIESMKMHNEIRSETDAFIKTIQISEGDLVQQNQILITFKLEKAGKGDLYEKG